MGNLTLVLTFAEITFPILLLVPPLVTSFHHFAVPPRDLAKFSDILIVDYWVIVLAAVLSAVDQRACLTVGFLIVSASLVFVTLVYVIRWTTHEQVEIWLESLETEL